MKRQLGRLAVWGLLSLGLQFCAQSRRGNVAKTLPEVWGAQELCNSSAGQDLRCFSVEPHISENYAVVAITKLDFNPAEQPYRLVARPAGFTTWHLLADQLITGEGGTFEIDPQAGVFIEEYEEFLLETVGNVAQDVISGIVEVKPGLGVPLIWGYIDYPELYEIKNETSSATSTRR